MQIDYDNILYDIDYKSIGALVKKCREDLKMTQENLSEKCGISTSHISNIENGTAKVSMTALIRIANALKTTMDFLLSDNQLIKLTPVNNRIAEIVDDCTDHEIGVILDIVETTKKSLRTRHAFPQDHL